MPAVVVAHQGPALAPSQAWAAWNGDPLVLLATGAAAGLYLYGWWRTRRRRQPGRPLLGALGLAALAVAVVSPLDALAATLASAHMVQHMVLILVAAPLLVAGGAPGTMVRGLPPPLRRAAGTARRSAAVRTVVGTLRRPVTAWALHAGALWVWHSAVLYQEALRSHWVHGLEHVSFVATALLFWSVVLGARGRVTSPAPALLLVFTMALQGVVLSALLTFSPVPWYPAYAESTRAWGLDPLLDQQLAGVTMWVPGGLVYLGAALVLLAALMRQAGAPSPPPPGSFR